ncbi:hypothetical protein PVAP13_8NG304020 [Panicum virgatum]|uniref:non-specific serine/threonine protein kinase n=1 Tax=Panicum virgatum TaxID=38727 RepID=A0A8T0PE78_PANVG|nr:hypothetical protein PVAP13_8NG304020 [Panicum virgatum]
MDELTLSSSEKTFLNPKRFDSLPDLLDLVCSHFFFFCSRSRACSVLCAASCVRQEGSMADPVATVERIVKIGLKIKEAVDKARHNEEDCREITRQVLMFSAILSQLQQTGTVADSPAMAALEALEETLQRALELVTACQERTTIRRLVAAGDLSKQLRRVRDDISNNVMLASFAINVHTNILVLTIQAGVRPLPLQQQADAGLMDISNNIHSTEDARSDLNGEENIVLTGNDAPLAPLVGLKNFSLSALKDAINGGIIIGKGGSCKVYKGVMDGTVVAIKAFRGFRGPHYLGWEHTYDQLLLASKLKHRNIVKVLGYSHEVGSSSVIMQLLEHKNRPAKEIDYFWVEEYMPKGTLSTKSHESLLDWPSVSRILEQVAQGIHYLHEQRIVHRNLKPSNILLDSDMNPKIIDFEFSMVLNDEITEDCVKGTLGYIPPEYTMRGTVSMKNDIFAFGVILLETVSCSMCRSKPPEHHHPTYEWVSVYAVACIYTAKVTMLSLLIS